MPTERIELYKQPVDDTVKICTAEILRTGAGALVQLVLEQRVIRDGGRLLNSKCLALTEPEVARLIGAILDPNAPALRVVTDADAPEMQRG